MRGAAPLALVLALLAGVLIGQLRQLDITADEPAPLLASQHIETVDDFYAAIDHLLQTGDPGPLRAMTAPNFVHHDRLEDAEWSPADVERDLLLLRDAVPGLRIEATRVTGSRELVAVETRLTGVADPTIAGMSLDPRFLGEDYELLRVQNGRIAERWTGLGEAHRIRAIARFAGVHDEPRVRQAVVERLIWDPIARLEDAGQHHGIIVVVETGTLHLMEPEAGNRPERSAPGDLQVVEPETAFALWSPGQEPATALVFSTRLLAPTPVYQTPPPIQATNGEVTRSLLARDVTSEPATGAFEFVVSRATVAPGAIVPVHRVQESEMLLIEQGEIEATIIEGEVWGRRAVGLTAPYSKGSDAFEPGESVVVTGGSAVTHRVTGMGPAAFWLITLGPTDPGASS
jgi:hypothetical protein